MVHIYNGISLRHGKEWNLVICRDVDGPGECHTEWSKSEREKQISYINAYMWDLEKWCRWSYLQTEIETQMLRTNVCICSVVKEGLVGEIGRLGLTHIHYWYYV